MTRLFLIVISLACVSASSPIESKPPGFDYLFNSLTMMTAPTDTVAFSSEDPTHVLMQITYTNFMGHECVFDASYVTINDNLVKCTFENNEIVIDRRKISHMYIIEID